MYSNNFKGFVSTGDGSFKRIIFAQPLDFKQFYIVFNPNPDRKDKVGHWTLLIRLNDGVAYYDSTGNPPIIKTLSWLEKQKETMGDVIAYSTFDAQHSDSALCGYYVLYVLDRLFLGNPSPHGNRFNLEKFNDIVDDLHIDNFDKNHSTLLKHFSQKK